MPNSVEPRSVDSFIAFFKTEDGGHGTPFIELDKNILQYVNNETADDDVKNVFRVYPGREGR